MKCEELAAIMERSKASPSLGYAFTHYKQDVEALLAWTHDLECKAEILHDQLKAANLQNGELTIKLREVTASNHMMKMSLDGIMRCEDQKRAEFAAMIVERDDALRLNQELQKKLDKADADLLEEIENRDRWEDKLSELAVEAGCHEEWSNLHSHGDCITNLWDAKVNMLRKALERYAAGCEDCKGDRTVDCYCGYARAALKETETERPIHEIVCECDCDDVTLGSCRKVVEDGKVDWTALHCVDCCKQTSKWRKLDGRPTEKRVDPSCFVCGAEATGKIGAEPRCERHV